MTCHARHAIAQSNKNPRRKGEKSYVSMCQTLNRKATTSNTTQAKIAASDGKVISAKSNISNVCEVIPGNEQR
jgi:hypothetical protein